MAEAFLKKYAGEHFEVYSAGFRPRPIHPYTIKVMSELGYDLSNQQPKALSEYLGKIHFGDSHNSMCESRRGLSYPSGSIHKIVLAL